MNRMKVLCPMLLLFQTVGCLDTSVDMEQGTPKLRINGTLASPLVLYASRRAGASKIFTVTPDWREYRLTFTSPGTDRGGVAIHVRSGEDKGDLWVDDVTFVSRGRNAIRGGAFDGGQVAFEENWRTFIKTSEGVKASVNVEDGILHFNVAKSGKSLYHVHIYQPGHTVEKGKTYTISARMKASSPRKVDFIAVHQGEPWTHYSVLPAPAWHEIELAASAGVHIHSFGLRMPWPRPGEEADFSSVSTTMDKFLTHDPKGMLIPRIGMEPPEWWKSEHPDDVMVYDDGTRGWSCVASESWRRDAAAALRRYVEYLEKNYGDHIFGYHPCGQNTGEWFYKDSWRRKLCGFSPAMRKGFRRWLRKKYGGDIEALNRRWKANFGGFESVDVPTREERLESLCGSFRDPERQGKAIDFSEYMQVAMVEPLEMFAQVIKEATERRTCVVYFYGYLFEFGPLWAGAPNSGHYGLRRILESPDIDILCSPISYFDRGLGGIGAFMAPVDSIQLHGKLWLNEDDTRTHLSAPDAGYGRVGEVEHTRWVHQRNFGQIFVRRAACWWMDLPGLGWLDSPHIWKDIGEVKKIYDANLDIGKRYETEVAVIIDEASAFYLKPSSTITRPLIYNMRADLYRMGTPFGLYLLDDLIAGNVPPAKLYVFLNAFRVTKPMREAVHKTVRREGRTSLWLYAPGYISDKPDLKNMEALTGIRFRQVSAAIAPNVIDQEGNIFGPQDNNAIETTFAAAEPQENVIVLGRYADAKNDAAFAVRQSGDWRSVFVGSTRIPARLLRDIARGAGVHIYVDSDDVLATNGRFLCIQASEAGRKDVSLPRESIVRDAITGDVVAKRTREFVIDMKKGETRLFFIH